MNHRSFLVARLAAGLVLAASLSAQAVKVYSEFRRVDPFGEIVAADREGRPREILSPLLARNSHSTFHVVVTAPPGKIYYFYITQNPEDILNVKAYKAMYHRRDRRWIPDRLLLIDLPYTSHVPDRYHGITNQTSEIFVVDVWIPRDAEPGRMKLDASINVDGQWVNYPMEVRVSDVVVPDSPPVSRRLPPLDARADASALGPLRHYLCGELQQRRNGPLTIRKLIHRNVVEDLALARTREADLGAGGVAAALLRGLDIDRPTFCSATELTSRYGPEWFLRARDLLYRGTIEYY